MKIKMPVSVNYGRDIVIDVELVDVAPHIAHIATMAIGPQVLRDGHLRGWRLHNVETGSCIASCDHDTRNGCLKAAVARLRRVTPEEAESAMRAFTKRL